MNSLTWLKAEASLVLVCGKRPCPNLTGGRDRILHYAKTHLKKFQFFMAESIFDLFNKNDIDLLSLEESLLDFCDCVLVILESESTFAELGAFAIKKELVRNMLVVNDINYRAESSFISLGPLAKVSKQSRFGPVIHVDLKSILRAAPELAQRLSKIERKYNKRIDLSSLEKFKALKPKIRMLFLLDMVTLFQPLTRKELIEILSYYYGDIKFDISLDLHLLSALGQITETDKHYLRVMDSPRLFFTYKGIDNLSVRSDVINHYHKYSKERVAILRSKTGGL